MAPIECGPSLRYSHVVSRRKPAEPNPALPSLESGASLTGLAIDNLRALRMPEPVSMRRLLILVGRNGIGKSTFARFFPLLRQSLRGRTREPLLWWERDQVDFGSYGEALRRGADTMGFTFQFRDIENHAWEVRTSLRGGPDGAWVCSVEVVEGDDSLRLTFSKNGQLESLQGHGDTSQFNLSDFSSSAPFYEILQADPSSRFGVSRRTLTLFGEFLRRKVEEDGTLNSSRVPAVHWFLDGHFLFYRGAPFSRDIPYRGRPWADVSWLVRPLSSRRASTSKSAATKLPRPISIDMTRLTFVWRALERLALADLLQNDLASSTAYLGPFRAVPERSYRPQAVDIEQLDPRGANLALFLGALSMGERDDLNVFVGSAFGFQVHLDKSTSSSAVMVELEGARFNLLDVGFGYSQVLPVAVQLWAAGKVLSNSRAKQTISTLVIEQPELHLHPHQQVLVARALAASAQADKGPMLVIETHSDHLVSEIGIAVAEGRLSPERVSVLCVEPHPEGGAQVRTATYDTDGVLQNWPDGFLSP